MSITFFFFNDTATTEIYTLSLHDALPIWSFWRRVTGRRVLLRLPGAIGSGGGTRVRGGADAPTDRRPAPEAGRGCRATRPGPGRGRGACRALGRDLRPAPGRPRP